ncbi:MAG: tryptophan synthase subunit alpha [Saprospiraceae bacterium]|nr:tryptophan synthase subunit alpha [Saprospiraceae bacterium]
MNRIDALFQSDQKNLLNIYFTAGFPERDSTLKIIQELDNAGVDLIEIGMPYSDPLADGPTIQESGSMALKNGFTLDLLFEQLQQVRSITNKPLILMGYLNQLMQYGLEAFCQQAQACGIDGLIIPDMPLDLYAHQYQSIIEAHGLHSIFLITPRTPDARIRKVDTLSKGFIYMVADSSITGKKGGISEKQVEYFERINAMNLNTPRLIGFGISDHATFSTACNYAQGAIIGSAFIRHLDAGNVVADFVKMVRGE